MVPTDGFDLTANGPHTFLLPSSGQLQDRSVPWPLAEINATYIVHIPISLLHLPFFAFLTVLIKNDYQIVLRACSKNHKLR